MNGGLIPHRYAKALYKFALEHNSAQAVYDEMHSVVRAFEENPGLLKALSNPSVSAADKSKLLITAAGPEAENDYKGFVRLIIDNKREAYAYEMALAYRDIYREANNISTVRITTAMKLPDAEMAKLHALIEKSFPENKLEFTDRIDASIIGGFVIDVDQVRMDASISNEIENLRQKLFSTK